MQLEREKQREKEKEKVGKEKGDTKINGDHRTQVLGVHHGHPRDTAKHGTWEREMAKRVIITIGARVDMQGEMERIGEHQHQRIKTVKQYLWEHVKLVGELGIRQNSVQKPSHLGPRQECFTERVTFAK